MTTLNRRQGLAALASPIAIRRDTQTCIDCAKCAHACPSLLPVDRLVTIRSAECTGCLECVAACPAEGALQLTTLLPMPGRKSLRVSGWAMAAGIAVLFLGIVSWAKITGHWDSAISYQLYQELIPRARELSHP